ncbi:MAG: hypothetical protein VKP62_10615 [Candidatus Sericytochromatia bacterium]|nr:hypothetical protein [Candidatus Sericytochromatia bacterium]
MKRILFMPVLTALLAFGLMVRPAEAITWPPVPVDKAAHFGLSYVITDQLIRAGRPVPEAVLITIALGGIKEVLDSQFDPLDLAADVSGSFAGAFLRFRLP